MLCLIAEGDHRAGPVSSDIPLSAILLPTAFPNISHAGVHGVNEICPDEQIRF